SHAARVEHRDLPSSPTRRSSDLDDTGCAVANSIAAVQAGATHVQCTANGYGERAGNADLFVVAGNLVAKLGMPVLPEGRAAELRSEEHTSELQSRENLVCRLLLE